MSIINQVRTVNVAGNKKNDESFKITNHRLNGIMITSDSVGKGFVTPTFITITHRSPQGNEILVNRVDMSYFYSLTEMERGYTRDDAENNVRCFIDLGYIDLELDELEIRFEQDKIDDESSATASHKFYVVLGETQVDHQFKYTVTNEMEAIHHDTYQIYLVDSNSAFADSGNITIKAEGEQYLTDLDGLRSLALINGEVDSIGIQEIDVIKIYQSSDEILDSVDARIQLVNPSATVKVLHISKVENAQRVSESTVKNARRLYNRMVDIERKDPNKARVLRHAYGLPSLDELAEEINYAEARNAEKY